VDTFHCRTIDFHSKKNKNMRNQVRVVPPRAQHKLSERSEKTKKLEKKPVLVMHKAHQQHPPAAEPTAWQAEQGRTRANPRPRLEKPPQLLSNALCGAVVGISGNEMR
jgi:hypothetical protein